MPISQDLTKQPNIYNIASNYHFFNTFFDWFSNNFSDKSSECMLLFANRRAVREFEKYLKKNKNLSKPKFKAISDINQEDFLSFFDQNQIKEIYDEIIAKNNIDNFNYLFFLTHEVLGSELFGDLSFAKAFNISLQLKKLFDDINRSEVDLTSLDQIDDSDFSKHRQVTLEFLKKSYAKIKNSIIKNEIFSNVSYQNSIINNFSFAIEKYGISKPLLIVGSTGSLNYSKRLIAATLAQKNGYTILYGLDKNCENFQDETHYQHILNELFEYIKVEKQQVKEITNEHFKVADESRLRFISELLLPALKTEEWSQKKDQNYLEKISTDIKNNFTLLEAKNEVEEARVIAIAAAQGLYENKKTAIIANNSEFVKLIKLELDKFNLEYNDARSLDLSGSKLVNLFLLLLESVKNNFNSANLLSILKHEWSKYIIDRNIIEEFEIKVLREQRTSLDFSGIENKLNFLKNEELNNFFSNFKNDISLFLEGKNEITIKNLFENLALTVEKLSNKNFAELIALEPAKEEIMALFGNIKKYENFYINLRDSKEFFINLFSQIAYFEKSDSSSLIQIISPIEARLLNFDRVIITSLNYGEFPEVETDNWLGKKIRSQLGVDFSLRKYGQNSYDFANYISAPSVILTRSRIKGGATSIASPFILRFKILCEKYQINFNNSQKYFEILEKLNEKTNQEFDKNVFSVPLQYRPKKLSITDISKLIFDPYQIYAKKILQLEKLNKIDYEPEYKEFGSFIHKALEEFIISKKAARDFIFDAQKIFHKYFIYEEAKLIWWVKFENILKNFIKENNSLNSKQDYVEVAVEMVVKNILISGKIDRISIDENGDVSVFDYKTGQMPTIKDVLSGLQPQVVIYILALCYGVIKNKELNNFKLEEISSLNYWKIGVSETSTIKEVLKNNEDIQRELSLANLGFECLIEYFNDENNPYNANPNGDFRSEYWHLARVQ